ncbi:MAG TPA: hypothetical protein VGJ00_03210 [Rhabdochlamydiaceae bacterium]|jgi:hypothetical protein
MPLDKKKLIAEESAKTRKAREKLKKQLDANDKKITQQALERKSIEIHRWIARHAHNRVILKSKSISLFDENRNTAEVSQRVCNFVEQINRDAVTSSSPEQMSKLKEIASKK